MSIESIGNTVTEIIQNIAIWSNENIIPITVDVTVWFVDKLLPALLSVTSAIVVIFVQKWLEKEHQNLVSINKWMMTIDDALQSLIAFKFNYSERLTENLFQRVSAVPPIFGSARLAPLEDQHELLFLVSPRNNPDSENFNIKVQPPYIKTILHQYNSVIEMWTDRNELRNHCFEEVLAAKGNEAASNVTPQEIIDTIGKRKLAELFQKTEQCIALTDSIIEDLHYLTQNLPKFATTQINKFVKNRYGDVISFDYTSVPSVLELLKKTVEPDLQPWADLIDIEVSVLKDSLTYSRQS